MANGDNLKEVFGVFTSIVPEMIKKYGAEDTVNGLLALSGFWAHKTKEYQNWAKMAAVQARMLQERQNRGQ